MPSNNILVSQYEGAKSIIIKLTTIPRQPETELTMTKTPYKFTPVAKRLVGWPRSASWSSRKAKSRRWEPSLIKYSADVTNKMGISRETHCDSMKDSSVCISGDKYPSAAEDRLNHSSMPTAKKYSPINLIPRVKNSL